MPTLFPHWSARPGPLRQADRVGGDSSGLAALFPGELSGRAGFSQGHSFESKWKVPGLKVYHQTPITQDRVGDQSLLRKKASRPEAGGVNSDHEKGKMEQARFATPGKAGPQRVACPPTATSCL